MACQTVARAVILYLGFIPDVHVNAVNDKGISPLMMLLSSRRLPDDTQEIVSLLEAIDFNYTQKDHNGRNMFCYAAMSQVRGSGLVFE